MDDKKRTDQIKGLFIDILIILVILGCIVGIVLTIFTRVNTQNVRNQRNFHIDYTVERISANAGSTIEFSDPVWLDGGSQLGTFQTMTLGQAQLILENGEGGFVTEAHPDDNVRSMTGKIYATGILSANNTRSPYIRSMRISCSGSTAWSPPPDPQAGKQACFL